MAQTTKSSAPAYAVESVDSALKILRLLCEAKQLPVSEVAERLDVAQSTAHRLLSMLVHHGFAIQEGRGREYRTGPMLLEMGFAAIRDMDVRQHARPILEAVRDKVNETVHLGVPYGQEVLYVEGVESHVAFHPPGGGVHAGSDDLSEGAFIGKVKRLRIKRCGISDNRLALERVAAQQHRFIQRQFFEKQALHAANRFT